MKLDHKSYFTASEVSDLGRQGWGIFTNYVCFSVQLEFIWWVSITFIIKTKIKLANIQDRIFRILLVRSQ